jgi:hypothetical protein
MGPDGWKGNSEALNAYLLVKGDIVRRIILSSQVKLIRREDSGKEIQLTFSLVNLVLYNRIGYLIFSLDE